MPKSSGGDDFESVCNLQVWNIGEVLPSVVRSTAPFMFVMQVRLYVSPSRRVKLYIAGRKTFDAMVPILYHCIVIPWDVTFEFLICGV